MLNCVDVLNKRVRKLSSRPDRNEPAVAEAMAEDQRRNRAESAFAEATADDKRCGLRSFCLQAGCLGMLRPSGPWTRGNRATPERQSGIANTPFFTKFRIG